MVTRTLNICRGFPNTIAGETILRKAFKDFFQESRGTNRIRDFVVKEGNAIMLKPGRRAQQPLPSAKKDEIVNQ